MNSLRSGLIAFTAFKVAVMRFGGRRPFPVTGASPGRRRMPPSVARNRFVPCYKVTSSIFCAGSEIPARRAGEQ